MTKATPFLNRVSQVLLDKGDDSKWAETYDPGFHPIFDFMNIQPE